MKGKARENLEVGLRLLEEGFVDAAANRLYYAVFQAAAYALGRGGRLPSESRGSAAVWDHRIIGDRIALLRGEPDDGRLFRELRSLRERADYQEGPVDRRELERRKRDVERFVRGVTE
ncbi:MAG TPA: HEPN domain-containing protein [Planctomycetota bacterium]|jgi:uncharacterized protein (UPF0332 family)|nr:HEPN domain-containing protein [Planctomycetota bacterium]